MDDELRWDDYRRLQAYDRLSLLFCMRDLATSEPFSIGAFRIEPRGPWTIGIDPNPFQGDAALSSDPRAPPRAETAVDAGRVP